MRMIVLGCEGLSSSLESLQKDYVIKTVTILLNEALILCRERNSVDGTWHKLLTVKYNSAECRSYAIQEIEYFRDKNIVDLFSRGTHAIVIEEDGKVHGWGCHSRGQISILQDDGKGTGSFVSIPKRILGKSVVVQVACGMAHTLFLLNTSELCTIGNNEYGQLGVDARGDIALPTNVSTLHGLPISQIAAGGWHSFCVTMSGRVFSWGRNDFGQLGLGTTEKKPFPTVMEAFVGKSVAFIAAGDHHNAILTRNGELFTFGKGLHGQLGHGDALNKLSPKRVKELEGSVVSQVACGANHTVAYVPDCEQIFVFGLNENGQLGASENADISEPQMLHNEIQIDNFYQLHASGNMTLLLDCPQASSGPIDYRVVDKRKCVITLEDFCGKAVISTTVQLDTAFLSGPTSFLNCMNASFFLSNEMCSIESPAIDFDALHQASEILIKSLTDVEFSAFADKLREALLAFHKNPCNIEALRYCIVFPALMEKIATMASDGKPHRAKITKDIMDIFLQKLMCIKQETPQLMKWYESLKPDDFSLMLDFYKHNLEESLLKCGQGLLRLIKAPFRTLLLDHLKILNGINNNKHFVHFEDFYLGDVTADTLFQEYVDWREERKRPSILQGNGMLLLECPFLLGAKSKCLLLELRTRERLLLNRINIIPPNVVTISREKDVITEMIRELKKIKDLQKPLEVKFLGEIGQDDGALSKELFMLVFEQLLKSQYGLFVEDENSKFLWFDRNSPTENNELYNFIGKLCGLGVYNSIIVNLNFPLALYKKLLRVQTNLSDLKEVSPTFGSSLQQILTFVEDDETTIEDAFGLLFTTADGVPLKEGGEEIPLTVANREEYVDLYVKYLLDVSVQPQFKAFSSGFLEVFAGENILHELFTPEELMSTVSGTQNYDWNELKKNTAYHTFRPEDQTIVWFWEVLLSMSKEQKNEFLIYLTGSDKIPISGLKMKIVRAYKCDEYLPTASVCYNALYLHTYSTKGILDERLKKAIKCKGFHMK